MPKRASAIVSLSQKMADSTARSLRVIYPGAFYHIVAGGDKRKAVFRSKRDRGNLFGHSSDRSTTVG
jgi:hypothetical protein